MKLIECYADGYRNLNGVQIYPDDGMNVVYGDNAQGKTNFIESIALFSGKKNFRLTGDGKLIGFDRKIASLQVKFDDGERVQTGKIVFGQKNQFFLNRVPLLSANEFAGVFYTVVFSPNDLTIVQGEPRLRRRFMDDAISQIRPDYHNYCKQYDKILLQRNALLKNTKQISPDIMNVWDLQLAQLGTIITIMRQDYILKLTSFAKEIYSGISTGKENLDLQYQSTVFEQLLDNIYTEEKVQNYVCCLKQNQQQDLSYGYTTSGVHRDDLILNINHRFARHYASQGQQRSCVIALKLAEAKLLKSILGIEPIILLDDVMSELDVSRQDYILNHVKNNQVFLTCCDVSNLSVLKKGKVFHMSCGKLEKETKRGEKENVF